MPLNKKTRICVVTGSRADYGLLRKLMGEIANDAELELQIVVTGMHLLDKFGMTIKEIQDDGFRIDTKVDILPVVSTDETISEAIGKAVPALTKAYKELQPDIIILLGDRFEILSAAISAQISRIPIAHIHGGELTEGLIDEAFRHSISKMSHLHFVATEEYKKRVIQLGEQPDNVFLVGGLGVDALSSEELFSREQVERLLGIKIKEKSLLVTFHPVTLESGKSASQLQELLLSLSELEETTLLFTMPNSDMENDELFEMIKKFTSSKPNAHCYKSLGQRLYFSCLALVDGVVGNSSSGLIEAPSFKKGTINIGDRQLGRIQSKSVINCLPNAQSISQALEYLYSTNFQISLFDVINPYGSGGATKKIIHEIKKTSLDSLLKKKFYDQDSK
jgi:GDP/UDP-N,N'-diacetylbacillosamine 2-epimerase (hydrolysing)